MTKKKDICIVELGIMVGFDTCNDQQAKVYLKII